MSVAVEITTYRVCTCCMLEAVNNDDSACRSYYGHTHAESTMPPNAAPTHTIETTAEMFQECDGCHRHLDLGEEVHEFEGEQQ
ncbi:MAG: hypothetical protein DI613_09860 [Kocuria rhizophila]|nr:MAG: hypothetical protein DI613_09860 [Kocuria rhizophila]